MLDPIITSNLRSLGQDSIPAQFDFSQKIPPLYGGKQAVYLYSSMDLKQSDWIELRTQWKILVEKIKDWMLKKEISFSLSNRGSNVLNQDQILDRFIQQIETLAPTFPLVNEGKKNLEKTLILLQDTQNPLSARLIKPILMEFCKEILQCPYCANNFQPFFEAVYSKSLRDMRFALLQHKTKALEKSLSIRFNQLHSFLELTTWKIALLLHPNKPIQEVIDEFEDLEQKKSVLCLLQELIAELDPQKRWVTLFDSEDPFKKNLLARIKALNQERVLPLIAETATDLLSSQCKPVDIVRQLTQEIVKDLEVFSSISKEDLGEIKKLLAPWLEKIPLEEMYVLDERDQQLYLNEAKLQNALFFSIAQSLFEGDFFDRSLMQLGNEHAYVKGHLQLSWIAKSSQGSQAEKVPLFPTNWEKVFSTATQKNQALEFLLDNPIGTRNILLEMYQFQAQQEQWFALFNKITKKHLDRDVLNLLWHFFYQNGNLAAQEKIKYLVRIKIGVAPIKIFLESPPSLHLIYYPNDEIAEQAQCIESLISYLHELGLRDFSNAYLIGQKFYSSTLRESTFERANLFSSHFKKCDLSSVNFRNTQLQKTVFKKTVLQYTDFSSSQLQEAIFKAVSLTEVKNLEKANLEGARFYHVRFSKGQLKATNVRNALKEQIKDSLKMASLIKDYSLPSLVEIYRELCEESPELITKALTEKNSNGIPLIHQIIDSQTEVNEGLFEIIQILSKQENLAYLQSIFLVDHPPGNTFLHALIKNPDKKLSENVFSLLNDIAMHHPAIAFAILSEHADNTLLNHAIVLGKKEIALSILHSIEHLSIENQIALFSIANTNGILPFYKAIAMERTEIVSEFSPLIAKIVTNRPDLFPKFVTGKDRFFHLTPLELAISFSNAVIGSHLLDLLEQHYPHNPVFVLSVLFPEKPPLSNCYSFYERFCRTSFPLSQPRDFDGPFYENCGNATRSSNI